MDKANKMEIEKQPNKYFLDEDKKEFAFECKGVKYYQFKDKALPITYMRLKAAQETIALASELKVTENVLDEFQDMLDVYAGVRTGDHRVLSMTKEQLQAQLAHHNSIMRQRRRLGSGLEAMYLLASVFYFDESEDPAVWDRSYGEHKIKQWLGEHEIEAFFLRSLPLDTIISSELFQAGSTEYFQSLFLMLSTHSQHNYSMLSETEKESEAGMNIALLGETYRALINLNEKGLLKSTPL